MYEGSTVAVVVPAYDEEGFVGDVIDTVPDFVDRVYAVDDCSTDGTWDEIRAHADRPPDDSDAAAGGDSDATAASGPDAATPDESDSAESDSLRTRSDGGSGSRLDSVPRASPTDDAPFERRVVPIRHTRNRGVGAAIKTGYARARDDGIDVTVVMAGDGQMDPAMLERVVAPVVAGRADYAKGDRLSTRGFRAGMSRWRAFGNWLLTFLTRIASGYWGMADPQNGYTAISLSALEAIDIEGVYDDYGFANALLVRLNVHDLRVADVSMPAVYGDEESTIRYSSFVPKLSVLLLRSFLWRLHAKYLARDCHPLSLLYGLGAVGTGAGLLAALRRDDEGLTATLVGAACLVAGMVLDRADNEDLHSREEP